VPIPRRIGLEIDVSGAASQNAIFTGHGSPLGTFVVTMHNNASVAIGVYNKERQNALSCIKC
jgi:hypothetical protein